MVRKQIYIEEDLDQGLKVLAQRTGQPEAAHVRAAVREYLETQEPSPADQDPLLQIIGLVGEPRGPDDVAEQHDHYLYGAPKAR